MSWHDPRIDELIDALEDFASTTEILKGDVGVAEGLRHMDAPGAADYLLLAVSC